MKEFRLRGPSAPDTRLTPWLAERARLPPETVERMLSCGAVVVRFRGQGPWERVRDGRLKLHADDHVHATYEPRVLNLPDAEAGDALWAGPHYGVWVKPAGMMSQGSAAGDHCSLLRAVEKTGQAAFLVHRLDRETEGLMLIAHSPKAAAALSEMFQRQEVRKTYLAIAVNVGCLARLDGVIDGPLDGKPARTGFQVLRDLGQGRALLELHPLTGRLHQLRRHLAMAGSGVLGDPKYGKGNKNRDGLKLAAVGLTFTDPFENTEKTFAYKASFADA